MRLLKTHPILGLLNHYLVDAPEPANISYMWNFGSLLGACLGIQIATGVFLAMHYTPSVDLAFVSVEHIIRDVNYGWLIRYIHANTASFFFIFVYLHIARGLYYGSYKSPRVLLWSIGVIILILMIVIAFLGYVLPYGQMSLWGSLICPTCVWVSNVFFSSILLILVYLHNGTIAKRISAASRVGPHNYDIINVFYGCLLGDAHAERRLQGHGTRVTFYQEANHKEYLLWLHKLISDLGYTSPTVPEIETRLVKGGKIRQVLRFRTYTYSNLNFLHDKWYKNQMKCVPQDISHYLTPLALAIWIIDDGSKVGKGLKFCTNSFSYNDCILLSSTLHNLYDIKTSVQSAGAENQYHVYVFTESIPRLREIVKPFMVNSILYKLG